MRSTKANRLRRKPWGASIFSDRWRKERSNEPQDWSEIYRGQKIRVSRRMHSKVLNAIRKLIRQELENLLGLEVRTL